MALSWPSVLAWLDNLQIAPRSWRIIHPVVRRRGEDSGLALPGLLYPSLPDRGQVLLVSALLQDLQSTGAALALGRAIRLTISGPDPSTYTNIDGAHRVGHMGRYKLTGERDRGGVEVELNDTCH